MTLETTYASRNIGDIFFTLRKDETLNGAVEANGAEYNAFEFSIADDSSNPYTLCVNDRLPCVDYATYALEMKKNGCCAYFGIDSTTGRFRVPTLNNVYIKAGDTESLAKYLAPSLPNIKGITPVGYGTGNTGSTGPFYDTDISCNNMEIATIDRSKSIGFDASRASSIYTDDFEDVQVSSLCLRPMVQLVTIGADSGSSGGTSGGGSVSSGFPVPHVFVPGTQAKALEVNANFDRIRSYLGGLQDEIALRQPKDDAGLSTDSKNVVGAINELVTDAVEDKRYLLSKIDESATKLTTYVNTEIDGVQKDLSATKSSLQSNIDKANASIAATNQTIANNRADVYNNGFIPNYGAGYGISSGYVAPRNGWVNWNGSAVGDKSSVYLRVDGVEVGYHSYYKYGDSYRCQFLVGKGSTITFSGGTSAKFFPCKGT